MLGDESVFGRKNKKVFFKKCHDDAVFTAGELKVKQSKSRRIISSVFRQVTENVEYPAPYNPACVNGLIVRFF